jgi:hypothetical protein
MDHPLYDVTSFSIVGPYTLRVAFDDNTEQVINFEPVLYGEVYGPLRDVRLFEQVRLDAETHNLLWPGEADFDPFVLHEWSRLAENLAARARAWTATPAGEIGTSCVETLEQAGELAR